MKRRAAEAGLLLNTLVWGTTFVLIKSALRDVSPLLFLALRFTLATAALMVLFRGRIKWRSAWKQAGPGALAGVFLFSGFVLQTLGLRLTTAPKSAFLTGLCSLMVPFLAALVYSIRPLVSEVVGVVLATAGLALMTLHGDIGSINPGDILTVLCAVAFAAHIVTLGHFSEQMSYELLSLTQVASAGLIALSLFWWAEEPHIRWRPAVLYAILITGLLGTALAYSIQAWAQHYTTASRTALIYMLEPVFAWITSFVVAGEGLTGRAAAGAALIMSGVLFVEMKPLNPRRHPSH